MKDGGINDGRGLGGCGDLHWFTVHVTCLVVEAEEVVVIREGLQQGVVEREEGDVGRRPSGIDNLEVV